MREIKFRAWDGKKFHYYTSLSGLYGVLDPIECQYIGRKDRNGKEIYEGDVLKTNNFKDGAKWNYLFHKVIWDKDLSLFKCVSIGNKEGDEITKHGNPMLWVYLKNEPDCEIIGNIYENPELLNQ